MTYIDQTVIIANSTITNDIIGFHKDLQKGQTVKIMTALTSYETYVNRTDVLKDMNGRLIIMRANGAKIVINPDYIVAACVVERF